MPKGKKDKKSKKQRKKELEEKRRLEEELLREQQEEERKRQEELERQRREEEERIRLLKEKKRKEELIRLKKENDEDIDLIIQRQTDLNKLKLEQSSQIEWKKHLKCDILPDISSQRELNDFLTTWKEYDVYHDIIFHSKSKSKSSSTNNEMNKNKFDINHIKYYIRDIENGYELLPILQDVIYDAIQQEDAEKLNYAKIKYLEMGHIAQSKIDNLTLSCLCDDYFTSVADAGMKEDGDVNKYGISRNLKYGLWASSMSNAFKNSKIEYLSPMDISLELPKQIAMKSKMPLSCRCVQYTHNFFIFDNKSNEYESIGPIINVQILKLPSPPRDIYGIKNNENQNDAHHAWLVQNIETEMIKPTVWEYANCDEITDVKSAESLQISYKIPHYILIDDLNNIKLGWWNNNESKWKIDHFKDISFNPQTRIISFTTYHLSPICMIQQKGHYYKYKDWKLTPSGVERCKLSLITESLSIDIEIVGGLCQLLQPNLPELMHIHNKLIKPHQLIRLLSLSGIHLCCKLNFDDSLIYKNEKIESKTNLEISTIAALFEISMSKWNKIVNNNEMIIFRLRKPLTPNEEADLIQNNVMDENINNGDGDNNNNNSVMDDVDTWFTVMINDEKCTFIDCNEQCKELNVSTPIRELSHVNLLRCLTSNCTEDNTRDLQNTSFRFQETIRRMLNLLNLFRV